MGLTWNGEAIKAKIRAASIVGVDKTMSRCVIEAKSNHPGWKNVTAAAEGSVRIVAFAQADGKVVRGTWGSADIHYVIWLELKHGSFLRSAADKIYPELAGHIREAFTS